MRISSVNIAQPRNLTYKMRTQKTQTQPMQAQQPAFKGWKAGAFGVLGTFVGGAVAAVASGGALLPVLLSAAVGTTGGCIYGSSQEGGDKGDSFEQSPCYPNYRDY